MKIYILYTAGFLSLILMITTLYKIFNKKEFIKYNKTVLIIITLFLPILGYILVVNDKRN
jgi:predicted tellurium resistance membrane protein TerC